MRQRLQALFYEEPPRVTCTRTEQAGAPTVFNVASHADTTLVSQFADDLRRHGSRDQAARLLASLLGSAACRASEEPRVLEKCVALVDGGADVGVATANDVFARAVAHARYGSRQFRLYPNLVAPAESVTAHCNRIMTAALRELKIAYQTPLGAAQAGDCLRRHAQRDRGIRGPRYPGRCRHDRPDDARYPPGAQCGSRKPVPRRRGARENGNRDATVHPVEERHHLRTADGVDRRFSSR
jgi:hypothetical protein